MWKDLRFALVKSLLTIKKKKKVSYSTTSTAALSAHGAMTVERPAAAESVFRKLLVSLGTVGILDLVWLAAMYHCISCTSNMSKSTKANFSLFRDLNQIIEELLSIDT